MLVMASADRTGGEKTVVDKTGLLEGPPVVPPMALITYGATDGG